jgi:hypothetical protein
VPLFAPLTTTSKGRIRSPFFDAPPVAESATFSVGVVVGTGGIAEAAWAVTGEPVLACDGTVGSARLTSGIPGTGLGSYDFGAVGSTSLRSRGCARTSCGCKTCTSKIAAKVGAYLGEGKRIMPINLPPLPAERRNPIHVAPSKRLEIPRLHELAPEAPRLIEGITTSNSGLKVCYSPMVTSKLSFVPSSNGTSSLALPEGSLPSLRFRSKLRLMPGKMYPPTTS